MEDDVDIYADLPSFDLHPEKNDQDCNCKELKKELSSLISKLEDIQRTKTNLENNLFSLLKTARAEITRKDKMIDDLRKKLDDITFRRSCNNEFLGFSTHKSSHQRATTKKYENVPSTHSQESETESHQVQFYHDECKSRSTHSQENEIESHQIQFCHDEYKSGKPPSDVNRIPTVFGERLHKRIMEEEKEKEKQKLQLELSVETKTKDISKENIVKDNKENGSQFSVNNNDNESNIGRCSNSEPPYSKSLKRTNKEDDKCVHKRMKIENNEDKTIEETNYNYLTQYDLTDNPAQYEVKDSLVKFEGRLDAAHSFKKEEIPFYDGRRAVSEYRDTKQDQDCTNGWRSKAKSNLAKDHESSSVRNGLADNLRNSRTASTSNHVSERFNSGYKKNESRYSPSRRSYSRSRSDYESSNSHHLRERSSRTYKEKKYDDYKYDNRYKNGRLRRNYESEENDRKTRYRRRERGDLRDKSRYSSSDTEDKESSKSYKNKKYESHRVKKETVNVLNDKKLHESNKATAETNLRESSSRTIVNSTMNYNAGKNIEQHKNESEIKSINLTESTSTHAAKKDLDIPEEGEILDSPEKRNNSVKFSEDNKMEENNVKIVPVGDKNEDISVNASIDDKSVPLQSDTNSTKAANINTKKIEVASRPLQENSKDCGEIIQLNSGKSDETIAEVHNCVKDEDKCKPHINEDLMDSTTQNIGIIVRVDDSDINSNDKNDADKKSKNSITKTAIKIKEIPDSNIESVPKVKKLDDSCIESVPKVKELDDSSIESVPKVKELDDSYIESATKKKEMSDPNIESVVEVTEANNVNSDDSIHKINDDELRTSAKMITKVEAVPNCDIEDRDKSQEPIKSSTNQSETFHEMSNKSAVEMCLNDHNYVQNPSINVSDLDAVQKPSLRSERDEAVAKTTTSEETKAEKPINVQSVSVKKTVSSIAKNKKGQHSKGILISHRRKAVILSDSNASMTILMNTNVAKTPSAINNCNDNDSTLKPRACKISRVTAKATCK